jgi:hypothetical protein
MRPLSLNGVDGAGKSQQIRLLAQNGDVFHVTKPLIQYSERWTKLEGVLFLKAKQNNNVSEEIIMKAYNFLEWLDNNLFEEYNSDGK